MILIPKRNWKGNVGNSSILEDGELTPEFKLWADECSLLCGGIDILGLDLLHDEANDKYVILELNDTAIGSFISEIFSYFNNFVF